MVLATDLNYHGVGFDFNTMNPNPAQVGDDVRCVPDGKGMVVDDNQLMIERAGNAFHNQRGYLHAVVGGGHGRFIGTIGFGEKRIAAFTGV